MCWSSPPHLTIWHCSNSHQLTAALTAAAAAATDLLLAISGCLKSHHSSFDRKSRSRSRLISVLILLLLLAISGSGTRVPSESCSKSSCPGVFATKAATQSSTALRGPRHRRIVRWNSRRSNLKEQSIWSSWLVIILSFFKITFLPSAHLQIASAHGFSSLPPFEESTILIFQKRNEHFANIMNIHGKQTQTL